jgi:hypothetical protein
MKHATKSLILEERVASFLGNVKSGDHRRSHVICDIYGQNVTKAMSHQKMSPPQVSDESIHFFFF